MPKNTMLKLVKSADPLLVWRPQNRHVGGIVNLQKRILSLAKSSKLMVLVVFSVLRNETATAAVLALTSLPSALCLPPILAPGSHLRIVPPPSLPPSSLLSPLSHPILQTSLPSPPAAHPKSKGGPCTGAAPPPTAPNRSPKLPQREPPRNATNDPCTETPKTETPTIRR